MSELEGDIAAIRHDVSAMMQVMVGELLPALTRCLELIATLLQENDDEPSSMMDIMSKMLETLVDVRDTAYRIEQKQNERLVH